MRYFLIVLFLLSSPVVFAQDYKPVQTADSTYEIVIYNAEAAAEPEHPFNTFYYTTEGKPDGKLIVKTGEGKIIREAYYKNGKMGIDNWWFTTGQKQWEGDWQYINELKYYTRWYKTGSIESQTDPAGLNTHYYENGNKKLQVLYENGKKHGVYKTWYENGTLKEEGWYDYGKQSGKWTYYNEDGSVEKITHFD